MSLGIFGLSMLIAAAIAYRFAHYLTGALSELARGAATFGSMDLEHRIAVKTSDEIGRLPARSTRWRATSRGCARS